MTSTGTNSNYAQSRTARAASQLRSRSGSDRQLGFPVAVDPMGRKHWYDASTKSVGTSTESPTRWLTTSNKNRGGFKRGVAGLWRPRGGRSIHGNRQASSPRRESTQAATTAPVGHVREISGPIDLTGRLGAS